MIIYDPDYYPTPTGDSEMLFQYQTVNNDDHNNWGDPPGEEPGLYCTVGFQNLENNDGLQYTFDNIYHPGAAILGTGRAIKVTTEAGLAPPPDIEYEPSSFFASADVGQIATDTLHISNVGEGTLIFSLVEVANEPLRDDFYSEERTSSQIPIGYLETPGNKEGDRTQPIYPPVVADRGGPDAFGYEWIDSDEPGGPAYNWIDISLVGTPINWPGDVDDGIITGLPVGFDFPFYGNFYNTINVCTNGFVSFTSTVTQYNNGPIPDAAQPNNLLAAYWDDLNFESGGSAYYYTNNVDTCIIAYVDVPHYPSEGSYTFEVIMLGTGNIVYQYQEATGSNLNQETIGIENATGTVGLQIAYNSAYVHDLLAVKIYAPVGWLYSDIHSGVLESGEDTVAVITFDATELEEDVYTGAIEISCNDPGQSSISIPVTFNVGGQDCIYIPGDCNHNGTPIELSDVIAMISIYRGIIAPYYTCDCSPHGSDFAPGGDPNGNCIASELSDVVTEIAAYRGTAETSGCVDCPGSFRIGYKDEAKQLIVTPLKFKVKSNRRMAD
jgi:hypothetical protein